METLPGGNVDGSLSLSVLGVELGPPVHQEDSRRLIGLQRRPVEQNVPRPGVEDVRVGPSRYELGGEGVVVLGDVVRREVGGVKLGECQPQGTVPGTVTEVKIKTAENTEGGKFTNEWYRIFITS